MHDHSLIQLLKSVVQGAHRVESTLIESDIGISFPRLHVRILDFERPSILVKWFQRLFMMSVVRVNRFWY